MNHIAFLYGIICFAFGVAAYFFAILTAIFRKERAERLYVLFLTAFLLFLILAMANTYFDIAHLDRGSIINRVFFLLNLAAHGLMIYSLPAFIHAVVKARYARKADPVSMALAAVVCVLSLVGEVTTATEFFQILRSAVLSAVIAYVMVAGNIMARRPDGKSGEKHPDPRWQKILSGITIVTIILMPFSILIDMFPHVTA